jgi:hypothetical protein
MLNTLPEFVIFRILKILFYQNRLGFLNLCQTSQTFIKVHRKYFNQITRVWMAVRKIQFHYRHHLKNIRIEHDYQGDNLTFEDLEYVFKKNMSIRALDMNKIKNKTLNKLSHYRMKIQHTPPNDEFVNYIIPILGSVLRQLRIVAHGDRIGEIKIEQGTHEIVHKTINKKEICLYLNMPIAVFARRNMEIENPCDVYGIYCNVDSNVINHNLILYSGHFQIFHGIALSPHQYHT